MDLSFSPEDETFREEVRNFIERAYDVSLRRQMDQSKNGLLDREGQLKWQKALFRQGWAAPNWPVEYGGPGWTPTQCYIFEMEMAAAGAPSTKPMGIHMVGPVLMAFGSEEQKKQHLPPTLSSDVWWCQGYSEPGAGSDLASVQMRAENKQDHYLCNGTKIWTTHAQWADWIFCLVRTNPDTLKPQEGISFLLIDMKTPGIAIEPIATLDGPVKGYQEVNQVFFDDVKVPIENLIGEENKGWTYAKYLLEFERSASYAPSLRRQLDKVRHIAKSELTGFDDKLVYDEDFAVRIAELDARISALEFTELRFFANLSAGQRPGPESSMLKCQGTELKQELTELVLDACGNYAQPFMLDTWAELKGVTNEPRIGPDYAAPAAPSYFNHRKVSIYAGSNEIQRNIMAKRILDL